jgi:hypothetical protein
MPWSRSKSDHSKAAKALRREWETNGPDNRLFEACLRIQREAIEARMRECSHCSPQLTGAHWRITKDGDEAAFAMFRRHYSCDPMRNQTSFWPHAADKQFVGPGEKLVLMTEDGRALYAFRAERFRMDGQLGINCAVFRNEGSCHGRASELIQTADQMAWSRWPGQRIFTFVDATKVRRKRDPGRCFIRAGYKHCGQTATGKLIFERLPKTPEILNPCTHCYIPLVIENVRGAQEWVGAAFYGLDAWMKASPAERWRMGRSAWNFGSFHLWGDVPALMPISAGSRKVAKKYAGPGNNVPQPGIRHEGGIKGIETDRATLPDGTGGTSWFGAGRRADPRDVRRNENGEYVNPDGTKIGGDWFSDPNSTCRKHGSRSSARKAASAAIARIPFDLARHIAAVYKPTISSRVEVAAAHA